ncbi:hypothetical protein BACDOR_04632 [Phocaeicola dorei DSM 17855]|uniref:Uncharacterized protein n=1 Tax=Phocaeicola dorei DSM 17855 TaxID=483217 RepID=B6W4P8_9BACT|nr:hypothetical protein BACDOR_04632 [Phocaeicola dorei DSM 17855]
MIAAFAVDMIFADNGCRLSDHGIEEFYAEGYTDDEIKSISNKVYGRKILKFKSAMLTIFREIDREKGWVQRLIMGQYVTITPACLRNLARIQALILLANSIPQSCCLASLIISITMQTNKNNSL